MKTRTELLSQIRCAQEIGIALINAYDEIIVIPMHLRFYDGALHADHFLDDVTEELQQKAK